MKECDIFRGVKTYSDPPTYFQGGSGPPQPPHDLRPWTRHMRVAKFAIKMAHSHCFHPLLSKGSRQKHKILAKVWLDGFLHKFNISGSKWLQAYKSRDPISKYWDPLITFVDLFTYDTGKTANINRRNINNNKTANIKGKNLKVYNVIICYRQLYV